MNDQRVGELIQEYVHAKWAGDPDEAEIARIGARLAPALRERIDALGFDGEQLLRADALATLEALEREATEEDARARKAAARIRAEEEKAIDRRAQGLPHTTGVTPRRHRQSADRRRGRPRNSG